MKFTKDQASSVKCFEKFNFLRDEEISKEKIKKTYNKIIFLAHPDKGGSIEETKSINLAKKILSDSENLNNYKKALIKYNLPDGLTKNPEFSPRLSLLRE